MASASGLESPNVPTRMRVEHAPPRARAAAKQGERASPSLFCCGTSPRVVRHAALRGEAAPRYASAFCRTPRSLCSKAERAGEGGRGCGAAIVSNRPYLGAGPMGVAAGLPGLPYRAASQMILGRPQLRELTRGVRETAPDRGRRGRGVARRVRVQRNAVYLLKATMIDRVRTRILITEDAAVRGAAMPAATGSARREARPLRIKIAASSGSQRPRAINRASGSLWRRPGYDRCPRSNRARTALCKMTLVAKSIFARPKPAAPSARPASPATHPSSRRE